MTIAAPLTGAAPSTGAAPLGALARRVASRVRRIVLVQFNSRGDLENGGRFTVKKYHSTKSVTEDGWKHEQIELLPLNPDYDPIIVAPHEGPEMVVIGEWVSSID